MTSSPRSFRFQSIRTRVVVVVMGLFFCAWSGMTLWAWVNAEHEIEEVFDAQLAQALVVLTDVGRHHREFDQGNGINNIDRPGQSLAPLHPYQKHLAFQIWQDGRLVLRSVSAPAEPLTEVPGYSNAELDGERWRLLMGDIPEESMRVILGERDAVRDEMILKLSLQTLIPMLVTLPLLALFVILGVRQSLMPLQRVALQVRQRSAFDLQSLSVQSAPTEIQDLVRALNVLLKRLETSLTSERQFTANAAHELRTPLSALRTQVQLVERLPDPRDQREMSLEVLRSVDRMTQLVSQLLSLARVDAAPGLAAETWIELADLIEQEVSQFRRCRSVDGPQLLLELRSIRILGVPELIGVLVRNLLDNAERYALDATWIRIRLEALEGNRGAVLSVEDDGPGIPEDQRERVKERFVRLPGQNAEGSGLGLSIVRRIAELHDARLDLRNLEPHGLSVRVAFAHIKNARHH